MSTTILFACKSNSCRSQMAEAWAREWIKSEKVQLENRKNDVDVISACDGDNDLDQQRKLSTFLDNLLVASVALDESSVSIKSTLDTDTDTSLSSTDTSLLGTSPTSTITTDFRAGCITCDDGVCTASSRSKRRKPKEKAIQALAQDGVDISSYYAKSFKEILPMVLRHNQKPGSFTQQLINVGKSSWRLHLSFANLRRILENASREIGMAYAGVHRDATDKRKYDTPMQNETSPNTYNTQVVDSLIVLCSCPDSLKRQLSDMSKETLDWDITPPTAAAKFEGDGAYLRVSREIRDKVEEFMNQLKQCALSADEEELE